MVGSKGVFLDKRCILILGGARSGKSRFAQNLAESRGGKVLFVATAEALDVDMEARIEKHRKERPNSWRTLEASTNIARDISDHMLDASVIIIDCLTLLVSNLLLGQKRGFSANPESDSATAEKRITAEVEALVALMKRAPASFLIVSNEVGLGLVPENKLGRVYRDLLGRANQVVAEHADEVYFMVSGIPMKVKG